jgi:aminoglycoside 6-adenylyltransferase
MERSADDVMARLIAWGEGHPDLKAIILTSSRAIDAGAVDRFSDYDVILCVTDATAFADGDHAWQRACGRPLVRWGDEGELHGNETYFRGVIYEDFVKVDYTIWPEALLEAVADHPRLPAGLDHGYRVLLDKEGRTGAWGSPTHTAHVLAMPTEQEYLALVEQFWWDATYVPKALHRGELFFASSFVVEHDLKVQALRRLLEWRVAIESGWSFVPGPYGRGLERHLPDEIVSALPATYGGYAAEETWSALSHLIELFRPIAREVADALGYAYPQEIDDRMTAYLANVRDPDPDVPEHASR